MVRRPCLRLYAVSWPLDAESLKRHRDQTLVEMRMRFLKSVSVGQKKGQA